jgi:hypothetical protein
MTYFDLTAVNSANVHIINLEMNMDWKSLLLGLSSPEFLEVQM